MVVEAHFGVGEGVLQGVTVSWADSHAGRKGRQFFLMSYESQHRYADYIVLMF
jgi:hypothetical protein